MKGHDASKVDEVKALRRQHLGLARADRLHYYQARWATHHQLPPPPFPLAVRDHVVCQHYHANIPRVVCACDKQGRIAEGLRGLHVAHHRQDGSRCYRWSSVHRLLSLPAICAPCVAAKNVVPSFTTRSPKDYDAKEFMPLHIVGVLIHGLPDKKYFFAAGAHLAGNAALNAECFRRALLMHLKATGFRRKLHLQVDNASDNKNRYIIGLLGWLVLYDYVGIIELCMLMVGHTQYARVYVSHRCAERQIASAHEPLLPRSPQMPSAALLPLLRSLLMRCATAQRGHRPALPGLS